MLVWIDTRPEYDPEPKPLHLVDRRRDSKFRVEMGYFLLAAVLLVIALRLWLWLDDRACQRRDFVLLESTGSKYAGISGLPPRFYPEAYVDAAFCNPTDRSIDSRSAWSLTRFRDSSHLASSIPVPLEGLHCIRRHCSSC